MDEPDDHLFSRLGWIPCTYYVHIVGAFNKCLLIDSVFSSVVCIRWPAKLPSNSKMLRFCESWMTGDYGRFQSI